MIDLKTDEELLIMQKGGEILRDTLQKTLKEAVSGVTLSYLDQFAEENIKNMGGESSFKKVRGYKWTICSCVNDVVVHGIPDDYVLKDGDTVGIDCGVFYKGFHTDAAWTKRIRSNVNKNTKGDETDKFIKAGEIAFKRAVDKVKIGNYIYDISKAIEENIKKEGYSPVRTLVGHGVGRELHEEPEIPCFVNCDREKTPQIVKGMALAVEVIYNMGSYKVNYSGNDGWTITTVDGKISGLFESTVAVMSYGGVVLTPIESEPISYDSSGNN